MNHPIPTAGEGQSCSCGAATDTLPVLDAASLPPAIRHGSIMGAVESLKPGSGLELIAPHDPVPLLAQFEQRWPGELTITYLERDTAWRLAITRPATSIA